LPKALIDISASITQRPHQTIEATQLYQLFVSLMSHSDSLQAGFPAVFGIMLTLGCSWVSLRLCLQD